VGCVKAADGLRAGARKRGSPWVSPFRCGPRCATLVLIFVIGDWNPIETIAAPYPCEARTPKLGNIEREIFFAGLVVMCRPCRFQDRPEAFDGLSVDNARDILPDASPSGCLC